MKKTLVALFALSTVATATTTYTPDKTVYGNEDITLNMGVTDTTLASGITVVAKLDLDTFKSYMTGSSTIPTNPLIDVICGRSDDARGDIGVRAYSEVQDGVTLTGLCGTWNAGGTYNYNMGTTVLNAKDASFWTNVTGVSLTFISKLEEGVASGSGSTANKGATAVLTLEKTVDGVASYSHFGGQWYDGLFSSKIDSVKSISFDDAVLGADIYYSGVTVDDAKTLGISGIKTIPEPTTATLSLLALAGLAARRRRK